MRRALTAAGVAVALVLTTASSAAATADARQARSGGSLVRGLDISAYQHLGLPINWGRLARDGLRFVVIKVSEGTYYVNPYYRSDASNAARAGLAIMPYVFANPRQADGAATASFAVRAAGYRGGASALPLAVDLENDPYANRHCYGLSASRMVAWIAGFTARARALTGKRPVIYTTDAWWRECTRSAGQFVLDPLWLAAWNTGRPAVPSPWRKWAFWQYADNGFLPGIGLTDLDYFEPLGAFFSLHPAPRHQKTPPKKHPKPKPPKPPKPKPKPPKAKPPKPKARKPGTHRRHPGYATGNS